MIKPSNIDFTAPLAALLSYEKARFAGYDLEASTEEPVVLEEHDDYTLVGIKLKTNSGKDIVRKVKAYKNGETEVVDPEEPEEETDVNADADYNLRLTFAEDGQDVHRAYANPGDIVYAVIETTGLVAPQAVKLELNLNNAVASIDGQSTITLQPGVDTIVPILIESSTSATSLATLLVKIGTNVVGASRGITVAPTAVVPTAIILNPQDGNIGGGELGLSYSFDVENYSGHSVVATCSNPGVTFDTFNPAENRDYEGTIFVKFNAATIEDLDVLDIDVTIDRLSKTTSLTYHR